MANTYSQIYLHFVFAVQNRLSLIKKSWQNELYNYIIAIISNQGHKVYAINGMADHLHILISMNPIQSPSKLMYEVKRSSSLWINNKKRTTGKFAWQEGFGTFSYGKSQLPDIITYIEQQEKHHKTRSFRKEYLEFLKRFEIDYDERYIFKTID
jgi:REP element-mobilizing transposase RayT